MTSTNPKVSIVIPTYNRKDFIHRALNSIYYQTFRDFEIIVVDDGSKDNTLYTIKDYFQNNKSVTPYYFGDKEQPIEKDKLRYIRFSMNQGIPRALNRGYLEAKGDYICQLSSDDWWLPHKLSSQVEILDSSRNSQIGLIYGNYYFVELDDKNPSLFDAPYMYEKRHVNCFYSQDKKELFQHLYSDCCMNACTFLMRKEFRKLIGEFPLRPEFEWNQDLWWNLMCCLQDEYQIYKDALAHVCISIHKNQASKQGKCGLGNHILLPEMYEKAKLKGWFV